MVKTKLVLQDILASLQSDHDVTDICTCVYWTAVTSLRCGLASSMATGMLPTEGNQVVKAGNLLPSTAKALAQLSLSDNILEASIGMAAINSVLPLDESRCIDRNAAVEIHNRGKGKRIAVIGHFPFVRDLKKVARELSVFELKGRDRPGDILGNKMMTTLPEAEVLALSSTTLINKTFHAIMNWTSPSAYKIMIGPSTPLSSVLFDYGIHALSGSIVMDREKVLRCISQGANFRQVRGVRKVIMKC